jgi:hypothetical protein
MALSYTNILHCQTLKNLQKKDFWFENISSRRHWKEAVL